MVDVKLGCEALDSGTERARLKADARRCLSIVTRSKSAQGRAPANNHHMCSSIAIIWSQFGIMMMIFDG